jgi:hypothetical protein
MPIKGFDVVERAVKKSFDRSSLATSSTNVQRDADVKFYENLAPEAFDVIAATYGPDNLVKYIQAMESKKMNGVTNGNQSTPT